MLSRRHSLLCLKTLVVAPDSRSPRMRLAWFFSSLRTKQPGLRRAGMLRELVANPMPNTMASSTPRNLAVRRSSSMCCSLVPADTRSPRVIKVPPFVLDLRFLTGTSTDNHLKNRKDLNSISKLVIFF